MNEWTTRLPFTPWSLDARHLELFNCFTLQACQSSHPITAPLSSDDETSVCPVADQISFTFHISLGEIKWVRVSTFLSWLPVLSVRLSPFLSKIDSSAATGPQIFSRQVKVRDSVFHWHSFIMKWWFFIAASELWTFTLDSLVMLLRTDYTDIMKSITALCWCFLSTSCDAITKFNGIFVILTIIIFLSVVGFLARLDIMSLTKRGFCLVIIRGGDHLST